MASQVLVIDDDEGIRSLLCDKVKDMFPDIEALPAPDGEIGLNYLSRYKNTIRLIICDFTMPHMDGLSFIKEVRDKLKIKTPMIMISGDPAQEDVGSSLFYEDIYFL